VNNPFTRRGRGGRNGNPKEDINLQMARALFSDPDTTPEHRSQLQGIIASSDPKERERLQEASKFQWQQIVKAAADPDDPLSTGELNEATKQYQVDYIGAVLPNPVQLYKLEAEKENPLIAVGNTAKSMAKKFQLNEHDQSIIQSMISIDPDTGRPDAASVREAYKLFAPAETEDNVANVKNSLARVKQVRERLLTNPDLFDENSNMRTEPVDDYNGWGTSDRATKAYTDAKTAWEANNAEEDKLSKMQQGFSDSGTGSETADLAIGKSKIGLSTTNPLVVPKGVSDDDAYEMLLKRANDVNQTFYMTASDGQVYPVEPDKKN
jgi:hypothetical protein